MKLFMFYVGGNCGASNIELHDVRFSVGQTPEDCYADLRRQWWGDPESLHLDSWGAVEQADGYDISAVEGASGGERPRISSSSSISAAMIPANSASFTKIFCLSLPMPRPRKPRRSDPMPHKDRIFEVEKAIDLTAFMEARGYSLRLKEAAAERPFSFTCNYVPIG